MNERIKELAREAGIVNRKFSFGQTWGKFWVLLWKYLSRRNKSRG